jgi:hypothetical protein
MNLTLTQIMEHPECGYILAQAVAFAAMGTNNKTVNGFRKANKLIEGEHFVRVPHRAGMPKIHWTVAELQALAIALGTKKRLSNKKDTPATKWSFYIVCNRVCFKPEPINSSSSLWHNTQKNFRMNMLTW